MNTEEIKQEWIKALKDDTMFMTDVYNETGDWIVEKLNQAYQHGVQETKERAVKCVPEEVDYPTHMQSEQEFNHGNGFNSCRSEVLSNLNNI